MIKDLLRHIPRKPAPREYHWRDYARAAVTKTVREYARAEVKPEDDRHE